MEVSAENANKCSSKHLLRTPWVSLGIDIWKRTYLEVRSTICLSFCVDSVIRWGVRTFIKINLNITFADNELVEYEEGEDDSHRESDEAKLVRVDLRLFGAKNVGLSRYLLLY